MEANSRIRHAILDALHNVDSVGPLAEWLDYDQLAWLALTTRFVESTQQSNFCAAFFIAILAL